MKKKSEGRRESSLAEGWIVEDEVVTGSEPEAAGVDTVAHTAASSAEGGGVEASAVGAGEDTIGTDEPRAQVSNGALVLLGVLGGLYLLYTWVWISWAQYYSLISQATAAGSGSLGGVLQQTVFWAAPAAPALWFLCSVIMSGRRTGRLAIALLVGAVLLVPVPMLVGSGAAL